MFYSQYLFAIGVLSYLDLDDFYHPFAFASQQILLILIEKLSDSKEAFTLYGLSFHTIWSLWVFGIHNLNSDRSLDFSFATTQSILFSFFVY
jgi:hypothetical protein